MSKGPLYLLDVNLLIALTIGDHFHHELATDWFNGQKDLQWAGCAFTEAGLIRYVTSPRPNQLTMPSATSALRTLTRHAGYHYIAIDADWEDLCSPFFERLYGHNQVTDAYLLGIAVRRNMVLVTLDRGILHLAGQEFARHVLLLQDTSRMH